MARCEDAPCCGCCPDYSQAEPYDPSLHDIDVELVEDEDFEDEEPDPFHGNDVAADADVLASAGWGTDEDYGGQMEDYGDWGYEGCHEE